MGTLIGLIDGLSDGEGAVLFDVGTTDPSVGKVVSFKLSETSVGTDGSGDGGMNSDGNSEGELLLPTGMAKSAGGRLGLTVGPTKGMGMLKSTGVCGSGVGRVASSNHPFGSQSV